MAVDCSIEDLRIFFTRTRNCLLMYVLNGEVIDGKVSGDEESGDEASGDEVFDGKVSADEVSGCQDLKCLAPSSHQEPPVHEARLCFHRAREASDRL